MSSVKKAQSCPKTIKNTQMSHIIALRDMSLLNEL